MIRAAADRAVAGGVGARTPCSSLPARPTQDYKVAYALSDVRDAAQRAYAKGATESEINNACNLGRRKSILPESTP